MTLRNVLVCASISLASLSAFADDQSVEVQNQVAISAEAGTLAPQYLHGPGRRIRSWICQAESSHGSYQHYNGQPSYSRYEAQHSAIDTCQAYEQHTCVIAGCQPYGY